MTRTIVGNLNPFLREIASRLPAHSAIRRIARRLWGHTLERLDADVRIDFHGEPIWVRPKWRSLDSHYEARAVTSFLRAIRPGDTVWDVGAHVGWYALLGARAVGVTGNVVAWEPAPASFTQMEHHLRANGVSDRCLTIAEAVGENSGTIVFHVEAENPDSYTNRIRFEADSKPKTEEIRVTQRSLDEWAKRLESAPDVLKMDIEGAEVFALRGATQLLSGTHGKRPKLLLSVHPASIHQYGARCSDLDDLAAKHRYRCFDLNGRPADHTQFQEVWWVPEGTRLLLEREL